jgi:hypothetical protein
MDRRVKKNCIDLKCFIKTLLLFSLFVSIASCGPSVKSIDLDEAMIKMLRSEVRIYEKSELEKLKYQILKPVQATSCKKKPWDKGASKEDAIDQLRYKTFIEEGNAIFKVFCEPKESIGISTDCLSSVSCYGVAIRLLPQYIRR